MMEALTMFFYLVSAAGAQLVLPGFAFLGQMKFPFLLAVTLYAALHRGASFALVTALLAGGLQDLLSSVPLGLSSAVFVIVAWAAGRFRGLVLTDSPLTPVVFGALGGLAATTLVGLMLVRGGDVAIRFGGFILKMFGGGVAGMVATPVTFWIVDAGERLVGNAEEREELGDIEWYVGE